MGVNYNDQRFLDVEAEKKEALTENEQLYSGMVNKVYAILELCCNGEDPDTCEPEEHSCSGSCSTCGGCH